MLQDFNRELDAWNKKKFRSKIRTHELFPQMNEDDATKLLRIYAIQAVYNARAYCRNFDQLTGPQQMALSQMVYQMGVNLEEFTNFLSAINTSPQFDSAQGGAGLLRECRVLELGAGNADTYRLGAPLQHASYFGYRNVRPHL